MCSRFASACSYITSLCSGFASLCGHFVSLCSRFASLSANLIDCPTRNVNCHFRQRFWSRGPWAVTGRTVEQSIPDSNKPSTHHLQTLAEGGTRAGR